MENLKMMRTMKENETIKDILVISEKFCLKDRQCFQTLLNLGYEIEDIAEYFGISASEALAEVELGKYIPRVYGEPVKGGRPPKYLSWRAEANAQKINGRDVAPIKKRFVRDASMSY